MTDLEEDPRSLETMREVARSFLSLEELHDDMRPLYRAVLLGKRDLAKILTAYGADPHAPGCTSDTCGDNSGLPSSGREAKVGETAMELSRRLGDRALAVLMEMPRLIPESDIATPKAARAEKPSPSEASMLWFTYRVAKLRQRHPDWSKDLDQILREVAAAYQAADRAALMRLASRLEMMAARE